MMKKDIKCDNRMKTVIPLKIYIYVGIVAVVVIIFTYYV